MKHFIFRISQFDDDNGKLRPHQRYSGKTASVMVSHWNGFNATGVLHCTDKMVVDFVRLQFISLVWLGGYALKCVEQLFVIRTQCRAAIMHLLSTHKVHIHPYKYCDLTKALYVTMVTFANFSRHMQPLVYRTFQFFDKKIDFPQLFCVQAVTFCLRNKC